MGDESSGVGEQHRKTEETIRELGVSTYGLIYFLFFAKGVHNPKLRSYKWSEG